MKKKQNAGLVVDTLFLGPTRPTTLWGVTYVAFMFNAIIVLELFLLTKNMLTLLFFIPIHGIFYLLCRNDPQIFELINVWKSTKGLALLDYILSGGQTSPISTYTPLRFNMFWSSKSRHFF